MNSQTGIISSEFSTLKEIKGVAFPPICFLAFISLLHLFYNLGSSHIKYLRDLFGEIATYELYTYWIGFMLGLYWLLIRVLNKSNELFSHGSIFSGHLSLRIIFPFISTVMRVIFWLISINLFIQYAPTSDLTSYFLNKISSVLIIAALAWLLIRLSDVISALLLQHYNKSEIGANTRKIRTQILIMKRFLAGLIFLLALGASFMLFDNVRALGASVLTTAGIFGLVVTFAAQRSLGSVFAGLEIAWTQPIKIGDLVMIENEFGTIEEISFRSVIIKLWDLRRLTVPTHYFLEKPFQNWSRNEINNLIGAVSLYVDFTLPLAKLRNKVTDILKSSALWDGKTCKIQVYDLQEHVMQVRILVSAQNADDLSNLRCEIREKVIQYIVENYPRALPMTRASSTVPLNLERKEGTGN
ncbi:small-conductance mechanosensitive channel [Legionella wadsworthii]|uniref:Small-conductance mechanosensitive channel n=1 Tax=Legionella wadsworthii TaxID=28088 RepID=A0A378LS11_9GAMM|nr:mechanosensitive ion channel domain-containing protein [Legionella wadsworthii]STY28619.1 small-conductance mechanosensitive channel [Legionella wadsworthii]